MTKEEFIRYENNDYTTYMQVKNHEGHYLVSSNGMVYSLFKQKPIASTLNNGYELVVLFLPNRKPRIRTCRVHRLMAEVFIDNPKKKYTVNHINMIRNDNRLENLEWLTSSENIQHSWDNNRENRLYKDKSLYLRRGLENQHFLKLAHEKNRIKVICTKTGTIFNSIKEAAEYCGKNKHNLANMLLGKVKNQTTLVRYEIKKLIEADHAVK